MTVPASMTAWLGHPKVMDQHAGMDIKVEAVQLESGSYIQRITIGERKMLLPPLRDRGQADRLSAELRALLGRLRDSPREPQE